MRYANGSLKHAFPLNDIRNNQTKLNFSTLFSPENNSSTFFLRKVELNMILRHFICQFVIITYFLIYLQNCIVFCSRNLEPDDVVKTAVEDVHWRKPIKFAMWNLHNIIFSGTWSNFDNSGWNIGYYRFDHSWLYISYFWNICLDMYYCNDSSTFVQQ